MRSGLFNRTVVTVAVVAALAAGIAQGLGPARPAQAAEVGVSASGVDFSPSSIVVEVGDTVKWTNTGGIHTSTSGEEAPNQDGIWHSEELNLGQSFSFTFTEEGVFPYFCQFHYLFGMKGTVTVQAAATPTPATPTATPMPISILVNSTDDAVDANPGDGDCDDGAGNCTLRAAIMEANALAGADTITLPTGTYTISIAGAGEDIAETGDLDIADDLTISGAGADITIIDGNALDRVFHILSGSTVDISDVTVQNGNTTVYGGGILNQGLLALTDSTVSDNSASSIGGGIGNTASGTLTITNSTVSSNTASSSGRGHLEPRVASPDRQRRQRQQRRRLRRHLNPHFPYQPCRAGRNQQRNYPMEPNSRAQWLS